MNTQLTQRIHQLESDSAAKDAVITALEEALSDYGALKDQLEECQRIIRTLEQRIAGLQGERNLAIRSARLAKQK